MDDDRPVEEQREDTSLWAKIHCLERITVLEVLEIAHREPTWKRAVLSMSLDYWRRQCELFYPKMYERCHRIAGISYRDLFFSLSTWRHFPLYTYRCQARPGQINQFELLSNGFIATTTHDDEMWWSDTVNYYDPWTNAEVLHIGSDILDSVFEMYAENEHMIVLDHSANLRKKVRLISKRLATSNQYDIFVDQITVCYQDIGEHHLVYDVKKGKRRDQKNSWCLSGDSLYYVDMRNCLNRVQLKCNSRRSTWIKTTLSTERAVRRIEKLLHVLDRGDRLALLGDDKEGRIYEVDAQGHMDLITTVSQHRNKLRVASLLGIKFVPFKVSANLPEGLMQCECLHLYGRLLAIASVCNKHSLPEMRKRYLYIYYLDRRTFWQFDLNRTPDMSVDLREFDQQEDVSMASVEKIEIAETCYGHRLYVLYSGRLVTVDIGDIGRVDHDCLPLVDEFSLEGVSGRPPICKCTFLHNWDPRVLDDPM